MSVRLSALVLAFVSAFSGVALAEPLTGSEVKAFFQAGPFEAEIGSTFDFRGDGTFTVANSDGSGYSGSWTVDPDGLIKSQRKRAAKPDLFFIDENAGTRTLVFTSGRFKGQKFPLT